MLIHRPEDYIVIFLLMAALVLATIAIPFYGYLHKGWKGLRLGCLLQPVVAVVLCCMVGVGAYFFHRHTLNQHHDAALVVVRTTAENEKDTLLRTWYLKADGECLCESREADTDSTDHEEASLKLYDVVPLDSFSLGVDDRIVVRFNLSSHTATATDLDEPVDIVRVDWPKVESYFHK